MEGKGKEGECPRVLQAKIAMYFGRAKALSWSERARRALQENGGDSVRTLEREKIISPRFKSFWNTHLDYLAKIRKKLYQKAIRTKERKVQFGKSTASVSRR